VEEEKKKAATLLLMAYVLPEAPQTTVLSRLDSMLQIVFGQLQATTESEDITRNCLRCLAQLGKAVPVNGWRKDSTLKIMHALLVFSVDPREVIRKIAQAGIAGIMSNLKEEHNAAIPSPVVKKYLSFCESESAGPISHKDKDARDIPAFMCEMVGKTLHHLGMKDAGKVLEILFALTKTTTRSEINQSFLKMLIAFFLNVAKKTSDIAGITTPTTISQNHGVSMVHQVLSAIVEIRPHEADTVAGPLYNKAMSTGYSYILNYNFHLVKNDVPKCMTYLTGVLLHPTKSSTKSAKAAMHELITAAFTPETVNDGVRRLKDKDPEPSMVFRITSILETLLTYKFKGRLKVGLQLIGHAIRQAGRASRDAFVFMAKLVHNVGTVRTSEEVKKIIPTIDKTIGYAIGAFGPERILRILPLNLPTPEMLQKIPLEKAILRTRKWLLPLLKENIQHASLRYFGTKLLPQADNMRKLSDKAQKEGLPIRQAVFRGLVLMVWELFPAFCIYPTDIDKFNTIAKRLGDYITYIPQSRKHILIGIKLLIAKHQELLSEEFEGDLPQGVTRQSAKAALESVAAFAKNFLPIMFNLALSASTPQSRKIIQDSIEAYISISPVELRGNLLKDVIPRFITATQKATSDQQDEKTVVMANIRRRER